MNRRHGRMRLVFLHLPGRLVLFFRDCGDPSPVSPSVLRIADLTRNNKDFHHQ